jgi:peptidoglycan/LPS O-acetylase OafA/YrhL
MRSTNPNQWQKLMQGHRARMSIAYRIFCNTFRPLLPSFLSKDDAQITKFRRQDSANTAYLDGMRGVAAFVVFISHAAEPFFPRKDFAFENLRDSTILQLPIIRLVFSGLPMVTLFFVISGYSLAWKPLRYRHRGETLASWTALCSSALRRGPRLFMPCISSTFFVMLLTFHGIGNSTSQLDLPGFTEVRPRTFARLSDQTFDWMCFLFWKLTNAWAWEAWDFTYDTHLWTVSLEFSATMVLYLVLMVLITCKDSVISAGLMTLVLYCSLHGMWHVGLFITGAAIAQQKLQRHRSTNYTRLIGAIALSMFWIFGLFLLSFPTKNAESAFGYQWLSHLSRSSWLWQSLGAGVFVFSTDSVAVLQTPFTTDFTFYLGRISYALYLVHGPMLHTGGYSWIVKLQSILSGSMPLSAEFGWAIGFLSLLPITIWISDRFWWFVDLPSCNLSRSAQKALTAAVSRQQIPPGEIIELDGHHEGLCATPC